MEDVFAVGLIGIDDDLVEHRAQDPFLQVVRGVRMMPHSREVVAELKQVLPLVGGQDRLRAGERGEVRFELTDAGEDPAAPPAIGDEQLAPASPTAQQAGQERGAAFGGARRGASPSGHVRLQDTFASRIR